MNTSAVQTHPIQPVDRVRITLEQSMDMVGCQDRALFVAMLRVLRTGLDCAYHEAGAPYGMANGHGMLRWIEEVVNELECEEAGLSVGTSVVALRPGYYRDTG